MCKTRGRCNGYSDLTVKYASAEVAVVFSGTQQIDSLTDNEWTDLSDEVDNSSTGYNRMDLEIVLGQVVFTGTDSYIEVYIIPLLHATIYANWVSNVTTDEQENQPYWVGSFTTSGTDAAQRLAHIQNIHMPPGKFKFGIRSRAGVTLNSAGNDMYHRPYRANKDQ